MKNHGCLLVWILSVLALTALQSFAQSTYEPYTFTTLAGKAGYGSEDETGSAARFTYPQGVAMGRDGNVYVADTRSHTIRKVTPDGVVTTLAGLAGASGTTDGIGSDARFNNPYGVALDGEGNVYVADTSNCTIRKVTPAGVVRTLAGRTLFDQFGNPRPGGSQDGTGSIARFNGPFSVAVDSSGNVLVADTPNHTIRKVTAEGVVTTLAGLAGAPGSVDGLGSAARFDGPYGLAVDSFGNVYVADGATIRKVTPAGEVTTIAGNASIKDQLGSPLRGSADGTGIDARFNGALGVAVDMEGSVFVADTYNHTIRKVSSVGDVTTMAGTATLEGSGGSADGTGKAARFDYPYGVAVDSFGSIYVADTGNNLIRRVTRAGEVTTLAGGRYRSLDGTGTVARFNAPSGVALDRAGNVYVADTSSHTIRKISQEGVVTTPAGDLSIRDEFGNPVAGSEDGVGSAARFLGPLGLAVDSFGNIYAADGASIRKITPGGVVSTLASIGGSEGGVGNTSPFANPYGVAVDNADNIYFSDSSNFTIRKITPDGVVSTLAGLAGSAGSEDGTGSTARFGRGFCNGFGCGFDGPRGVAADSAGNVYVADTGNSTIRKVTPAGVVTTLAGLAGSSGDADGTGNAAQFRKPYGVAVDSSGNVYVADTENNTIRKVTPEGVVTTLAGFPRNQSSADGTGINIGFQTPSGVAVDGAGNIYVSDTYNNTIRKGSAKPLSAITLFGTSGAGTFASDGWFSFDLIGPTGKAVTVEASPDLVNWLPVWTKTFTSALNFSDPQSSGSSSLFYRARVP